MRRWLDPLTQDLRYAVRSFRRSPAFVLVALLSLTLGIGATSAIFSVIYGVLIAPYPYAKLGRPITLAEILGQPCHPDRVLHTRPARRRVDPMVELRQE